MDTRAGAKPMGRRARASVVGVLALFVAAGFPTAGVAGNPHGGNERGKPGTPRAWDERVLPFVDFVEQQRGLEFDHPVKVRFLSDKQLEQEIRASNEARTAKDKKFEEQIAGELLALGLIGEQVDLGQAGEDLAAEGTVGYYDPATEELVVRDQGSSSIDAEVTLVHELTHALQDQHFDLDKLARRTRSGSEGFALDFLVEGDATVVENAYVDSLPRGKQNEYFDFVDQVTSEPLPEGVPYALDIISAAPYVLGGAYVFALDPDGGTTGRNRAFERPPRTEEVLFDPVALKEHQRAKKVPKPELEQGEERAYKPEQFGVFTLYLMFSTHMDVRTALAAVTGWGGDSYVGFKEDGEVCLRGNVTGDTATDTNELEDALTVWSAAMPAGATEIGRDGDVVTFTACGTEDVVEPTDEQFDSAFYNVMGGRIYTVLDLVSSGVPLDDALCVGDLVSTDPEIIEIYDQAILENRDLTNKEYHQLDQVYDESFKTCAVDPPF